MLKLLIYGYSHGIRSSRKLERAVHHNVSFIWLTGGLKPDHKTIAEFRRKNKGPLKEVIKQCTRLCIKFNLIDGNTLFVDSTKKSIIPQGGFLKPISTFYIHRKGNKEYITIAFHMTILKGINHAEKHFFVERETLNKLKNGSLNAYIFIRRETLKKSIKSKNFSFDQISKETRLANTQWYMERERDRQKRTRVG